MTREVEGLISRVLDDGQRRGHLDLEASEMALRAGLHQIGGGVLEQVVNADGGGYCGAHVACGQGHQAGFVDYRRKGVLTVLAAIQVRRAYDHCAACSAGVTPKDRELEIVGHLVQPGGAAAHGPRRRQGAL